MEYTKKQLVKAVLEINESLGLEPPIQVNGTFKEINTQFKEALRLTCSDDRFSEPTQKVIDIFIKNLTGKNKHRSKIPAEEIKIFEIDGKKYRSQKIIGWVYDDNFEKVYTEMTAADEDWIRVGRLTVKANAGDKEAEMELKEMRNTPMYRVLRENGEYL